MVDKYHQRKWNKHSVLKKLSSFNARAVFHNFACLVGSERDSSPLLHQTVQYFVDATLDSASHFVTAISLTISARWGSLDLKIVLILMEKKDGIWMKNLL